VSRLQAFDAAVFVFVLQEEMKRIVRDEKRKMNAFMKKVSEFFLGMQ